MSLTSRDRFGAAADAAARPRRARAAPARARARSERGDQPRRDLRVLRVEREHRVGEEVVAGAVGAVELGLVRLREGADQRAHAVGIGEREGRMRGRARARGRASRPPGSSPAATSHLSMISGSAAIAPVEIVDRGLALRHVVQRQRRERRHAVGHVVGLMVLPRRERDGRGRRPRRAGRGRRSSARAGRRWPHPGCRGRRPACADRSRAAPARAASRSRAQAARAPRRSRRDRRRGRCRARCRLRSACVSVSATKAGSSDGSASDRARAPSIRPSSSRGVRPAADRRDILDQQRVGERLHRLPAVERIAVVRGEESQVVG